MSWTARTAEVPLRQLVAVPVDVGKATAVLMACDFTGRMLLPAVEFAMTRDGLSAVLARLRAALPADVRLVRVGVEAAGHYHRPLTTAGLWPAGVPAMTDPGTAPGHVASGLAPGLPPYRESS
jgi:Transposase